MAWIQLRLGIWTHWKTRRLAKYLGVSEFLAASHVLKLWSWAVETCPSGDLSRLSNEEIAWGACWDGDAEAFVKGLIDANWLEVSGTSTTIHEWPDGAGLYHAQKADTTKRVREHRKRMAEAKAAQDAVAEEMKRDVTVTVTPRNEVKQPRVDKSREEKRDTPPNPPAGGAPKAKPARAPRAADPSKSLGPLVDAFRAKGVVFPENLSGKEAAQANTLRETYTDDEIAQCFADIRGRKYGDGFSRANLSFSYLNDKLRMHNWRVWVAEGRRRQNNRDNLESVPEPVTMEELAARAKGERAHV